MPKVNNNSHRNELVALDIGGRIFKTSKDSLRNIQHTKLANVAINGEKDKHYDKDSKTFFFDRHPGIFDWILDGYRNGHIHLPTNYCAEFIKKDLEFWEINTDYLAPCCKLSFTQRVESSVHVTEMDEVLGIPPLGFDEEMDLKGKENLSRRERAWLFLEDPTYSKGAKAWGITFLVFVLLSVTIQCGMTLPNWRVDVTTPRGNTTGVSNPKMIMFLTTRLHPVVLYLDLICICVFAIELLTRFVLCPSKLAFITSVYNIIDLLSLLPMSLTYIMDVVYPEFWNQPGLFLFVYVLAALGVFRVLRLLKFMRHYMGMRILLVSLQESMREIMLLILLIAIGTLIFSNLIYFAEFHQEDDFLNIPIGFWWAIVTMTTVGYGDKHPMSGWGYVVGAVCAISGMLCTGLPIPIIASNFNMYYTYAKTRRRLMEASHRKSSSASFSFQSHETHSSTSSEHPHGATPQASVYTRRHSTFIGTPGIYRRREMERKRSKHVRT